MPQNEMPQFFLWQMELWQKCHKTKRHILFCGTRNCGIAFQNQTNHLMAK